MKLKSLILLTSAALAAGHAHAALVSIDLGGASETAGWGVPGTALTNANYPTISFGGLPSYPMGAWSQGLPSSYGNAAGTSSLVKLDGSFHPLSQGLYSYGISSNFSAENSATTLGSIRTIVFQTETTRNPDGYPGDDPEHVPDPEYAFSFPLLYLNGGGEGISPDFSYFALSGDGIPGGPEGDVPLWNWAWQWDLSSVDEDIASYSVGWKQIVHSSLISIRVDASDAVHTGSVLPVPEPSALLLGCAGFSLLLRRRR